MPRELSDVLHYFLPGSAPASHPVVSHDEALDVDATRPPHGGWERIPVTPPDARDRAAGRTRAIASSALPIVAVPVDEADAVRAALLWNLGVEIARRGGRSLLLRPEPSSDAPDWPHPGRQPLGAELVHCPARSLGELYRAAVDVALLHPGEGESGVVLVQVPTDWLVAPGDGAALLAWTLLLTRSDAADLRATWRWAKAIVAARPDVRLGVTIHGATSRAEAEKGFAALARAARDRLGRDVSSYGLLVDDLHVYSAVTARRPIGLTHPQSLAARALHDVAGILLEDANDLEPD